MRIISEKELKLLQLEILEFVHCFCLRHRLRYSLAYGTLIGAIRHKGYIPWDDDIDIVMPRPDYDTFISLLSKEKGTYYKVMSPEISIEYYAPYANVFDTRTLLIEKKISHRGIELGVKIDVFPLDGVPEDDNEYRNYTDIILWYNAVLRHKRAKFSQIGSWKGKVYYLYTSIKYLFYPYCFIQRQLLKQVRQYDFSTSKYIENSIFPDYPYSRCPKEVFDSLIDVDFEGKQYKAMAGYDVFLRTVYGDYLSLPPKEKRVAHHGFVAYWK